MPRGLAVGDNERLCRGLVRHRRGRCELRGGHVRGGVLCEHWELLPDGIVKYQRAPMSCGLLLHWRRCGTRGLHDRGILLPSGVILSERDAMRGRVLRDIRGRGRIHLVRVRWRVHLREWTLLPYRVDKQQWHHLPARLRVLLHELHRGVHAAGLLVPRG